MCKLYLKNKKGEIIIRDITPDEMKKIRRVSKVDLEPLGQRPTPHVRIKNIRSEGISSSVES